MPFVFVFSPSMLIVVEDFSWQSFLPTTGGVLLGITALSAAFSAYLLRPLGVPARAALIASALLLVAPEFYSTAIGVSLLAIVLVWQAMTMRGLRQL